MQKATLALVLMLVFSLPLQAAEIESQGTPLRKLQRGFLNIVFSPMDITTELAREKKNETFPPSWVIGLGRGSMFAVGRALVGVYEMVSFPLPDYDPVVQPEFAWQHLPEPPKEEKEETVTV